MEEETEGECSNLDAPGWNTHTHAPIWRLCVPALPGWASTKNVKPIWILLKQETVSGSGISWTLCRFAPCLRQITTPAPYRTQFYHSCRWNQQHQCTDFDWRTQWCASFDVPITLLVTGVLRPLVHVYGTGCHHIYASVIVLDNLNGCSRLICLVVETAALCDISVRSAVYISSYLLT